MKQEERVLEEQCKSIVTAGVRRPKWICSTVKQVVVLVRDASGSMGGSKARDASAASQALVSELAQPSNKDGFYVAVIDFSLTATIVHALEKATDLDGTVGQISPGGGTNITDGLQYALNIIEEAEANVEQGVSFLRPVIICFTDGGHNTGPHPRDVASQIKQQADLVTVAFGADADEALMQELASTPQHFYRCSNGRELRSFLAAVGATVSMTMASGSNATQALTMVRE